MKQVTINVPDLTSLTAGTQRLTHKITALLTRLDWLVLPLLAFGLSRLMIFFVGYVGDVYFKTAGDHWIADPNSPFLSMWAKWDSQWYVQIATKGYFFQPGQMSNVAFFPMYPVAMRVIARLFGVNVVLAGFIVSNVAFLLALIYLFRLTVLELGDRAAAQRTIFYLAFFPTAFFFNAIYTESLFLFFTVATMFYARRRWWLLAAAFGLLASATRNIGVLMWGLVMWEWLRINGWRITAIHRRASWVALGKGVWRHWDQVLVIAIIPFGLILYMMFLRNNFGSPTAFIEVQSAWNRENVGPIVILFNDIKRVLDVQVKQWYFVLFFNVLSSLFGLAMVPFVWRRLGEGYALYVLIFLLVPLASSTGSVPRYLLPLFPIFIVLGWWGRRAAFDHTVLATFAMLLTIAVAIFVNWLFVA